jgi:hypothetical protein
VSSAAARLQETWATRAETGRCGSARRENDRREKEHAEVHQLTLHAPLREKFRRAGPFAIEAPLV